MSEYESSNAGYSEPEYGYYEVAHLGSSGGWMAIVLTSAIAFYAFAKIPFQQLYRDRPRLAVTILSVLLSVFVLYLVLTPSKQDKNLYEMLDLIRHPDLPAAEVRKAYRKAARTYHPDKSTNSDAEDIFRLVQRAEKVLTDVKLQRIYDRFGLDSLDCSDCRLPMDYFNTILFAEVVLYLTWILGVVSVALYAPRGMQTLYFSLNVVVCVFLLEMAGRFASFDLSLVMNVGKTVHENVSLLQMAGITITIIRALIAVFLEDEDQMFASSTKNSKTNSPVATLSDIKTLQQSIADLRSQLARLEQRFERLDNRSSKK